MGAKNSKAAKKNSSSSKSTSTRTAKRGRKKTKPQNRTNTVSFKDSKHGESSQGGGDNSKPMARRRSSSGGFLGLLSKTESFKIRTQFTNHFRLTSSAHHLQFKYDTELLEDTEQMDESTHYKPQKLFKSKDFVFERVLGKGGFGIVLQAKRKTTGLRYALKVQPIETMVSTCLTSSREKDVTLLHMERTVLAVCRGHPFIVSLEYAFLDERYSILALECLTGGTLAHLIMKSPRRQLPISVCKIYTAEIALALKFMHDKGIIYRDLKPSNVLVDSKTGHIKLSDFGLAGSIVRAEGHEESYEPSGSEKLGGMDTPTTNDDDTSAASHESPEIGLEDVDKFALEEDEKFIEEMFQDSRLDEPEVSNQDLRPNRIEGERRKVRWVRRRTLCGTAGYRPPEQVLQRYIKYDNRTGYDERADWFALGSTCYTMIAGKRPFPSKAEILRQAQEKALVPMTPQDLQDGLLPQIGELPDHAAAMVLDDAEFRGMMSKIRHSSRFDTNDDMRDFIEKLLARNPHDRLGFYTMTEHSWMSDTSFVEEDLLKLEFPAEIMDLVRRNASSFKEKQQPREIKRGRKAPLVDAPPSTMFDFIDEMVDVECANKPRSEARALEKRWYADPLDENLALFKHWNFVSNETITLEKQALVKSQARTAAREALEKKTKKKSAYVVSRKSTGRASRIRF